MMVCLPDGPVPSLCAQATSAGTDTVSGGPSLTYPHNLHAEINLFFRFIIALAIVLFLLILTLWVLKRIMKVRAFGVSGDAIDILAVRYIDQRKAIALARVGSRVLIIGIAENSLTSLGELTSEEIGNLTLGRNVESGIWNKPIFQSLFRKKTGRGEGR